MVHGPFRGSEAIACGFVSAGVLRGRRYRRLFPDIYLSADMKLTPAVRSYAAFLLVERSGGVLAGYSAAEWLGRSCGPVGAPAEVVVPGRFRSCPGLVVHRGTPQPGERHRIDASAASARLSDAADPSVRNAESDVRMWTGAPIVTTPLRTAWDLARRLDGVEAVVAVDALARKLDAHRPGFEPIELLRLRVQRPGARGCRALERIVASADRRAESPMETRLRLLLVRSGLPTPHVQYRLFDGRGEPFVRFDLAYPEAKLAIEYDGDDHDDALDRARDVQTAAHGWHTIRLLYPDVTRTPARTVAAIREVRDQRSRLIATERHHTAARS